MEDQRIVVPEGVEDPRPKINKDGSCANCGAPPDNHKAALGGVKYCMKCGEEVPYDS